MQKITYHHIRGLHIHSQEETYNYEMQLGATDVSTNDEKEIANLIRMSDVTYHHQIITRKEANKLMKKLKGL